MSYPAHHTALSFLAHPDDAEILCGGTLIRLRELGWEVHIVTATPGDCGSATLPGEEIAAIRRAEGAAAAQLIGATYHCLEERDVNVIFDKAANRKVIDLFREISPALVFTHPRQDYMLDHEQVHLLARSAAFSFPVPNASALPLVDGAAIPWLYYCDPLEGRDPYSGQLVEPSVYVDVTNVMTRKAEMLARHASQREWLRSHHGIDEYIEAMKRHDAARGQQYGTQYAEAFTQHRGHAFPSSDILQELLGGK
jgi:LmbE family N-acetylglucosaminyl deacetylase